MTQFNVNGRLLDLPADGVNLQFKKSNPLFAFDSLECERSTSFDVPATPNNDVIFGLAKVINGTGAGMRVRYAAQLQADGVVKDGYLYVTSFSGGKYKCVFVTGELLGLQRLKYAGKVKEICTLTDTYTYGGTGTPAILKSSPFAPVAYLNENTGDNPPHISLRLYSVLTNCMNVLCVPVAWPQGGWEYVRIIPSEMHGLTESAQHFYRVGVGSMSENDNPQVSLVSFTGLSWLFDTALASVACLIQDTQTTTLYHGRLQQLIPRQSITISFPANFPSDVFVGRFVDGGTTNASECQFYGDYSFDDSGTITGDPLAGRTITIPANSEFVFLRGGDYMNGEESGGAHVRGWFYGLVPTQIDEDITLKGEVSASLPPYNVVNIADNLPDCTVVELLKVVAALTGTVLNYDDENGVTFSDLDCSTWCAKDLTGKVIETSDLTRTFGDYAQQNNVVFDSSDKVLQIERLGQKYTIQNENIEAEKELQKIPFDEGGLYGDLLFVRDADGYDKDIIADADTNRPSMERVHLPKCNGLQAICDVSTAVKLKVRMSLFEFNRLTAQMLLYSNNAFWVWNSAQWSKNVATFDVSKNNMAKVAPTPVTPMPKPNEVWVWPMSQMPDPTMVQNANLIGTDEINGIKICKYDAPILNAGRLVLSDQDTVSIIIFPEGFIKQDISQYWIFNQRIQHLYLPSTFQYGGYQNFCAGIAGYVHHVWLAWNSAPTYVPRATGYDRVEMYHVKPGMLNEYLSEGWPADRTTDDYIFDPWSNLTRGLLMGFESEDPTLDER